MRPQQPQESRHGRQSHDDRQHAAADGRLVGTVADALPHDPQLAFVLLHFGDERANRIHHLFAAVEDGHALRRDRAPLFLCGDCLLQDGHLVVHQLSQLRDVGLLCWIVGRERGELIDRDADFAERFLVRLEKSRLAGQKKAAHPGLGILNFGEEMAEAGQHLVRMRDPRRVLVHPRGLSERDHGVAEQDADDQRNSNKQPAFLNRPHSTKCPN